MGLGQVPMGGTSEPARGPLGLTVASAIRPECDPTSAVLLVQSELHGLDEKQQDRDDQVSP